jgi:arylsulfatase A-like enzyme
MAARQNVSRRTFLRAAGAAGALGAAALGAAVPSNAPAADAGAGQRAARRRPNVVFLLADQWRAQAAGYAGDPNVRTPHLDALAARSVNLANAVSGCPVCSPYRGSLMTGQHPLTHGVFVNDVCLRAEAVSLAEAFAAAGYATAYIGKWHLDGHGRASYIPPERRQGFAFWRVLECTHNYNQSAYFADGPEKRLWDGYDAVAQTREACRYIAAHDGSRPFLLVLSWGPPHNPYETAPERFRAMYPADALQLRPNVPPDAAAAARKDLAGYYAHCSALDECVGKVVSALAEAGIEDDTVLVFTSDHGDMLGSQGEKRKQKPWDESIRVPFLIRWPAGLGRDARTIVRPVSTPDIMPTLLGLAEAEIPPGVQGRNLAALLAGREPDGDGAALIMCPSPFGEWARPRGREYRGVRTARWTYVRTLDGPWLLFDNEKDPHQMRNLCGHKDFEAMQQVLEAQLTGLLAAAGDDFRPGWDYLRQWGYRTDAQGTVPYAP